MSIEQNFSAEFYRFLTGDTSLTAFEDWVYQTEIIESVLGAEDYFKLISLNYKASDARRHVTAVISKHIDFGLYYRSVLEVILKNIIVPAPNVRDYLIDCYEWYQMGFRFLDVLGLEYGLNLIVPPASYPADSFADLTHEQQQALVASCFPAASVEAQKVLNWLENGEIVLLADEDEHGQQQFIDNRPKSTSTKSDPNSQDKP